MIELPSSLAAAIDQSKLATQTAIAAGYTRLQVEFLFPELKGLPIAQQFIALFQEQGWQFKVYFPDAGAAALARRDWGNPEFSVRGMMEMKGQMEPTDEVFLIVEPSAVEVKEVEKMFEAAGDRPFVMLNPRLEDIATIGIGYAGRQLRERFLSTIEPCYSVKPLAGAAIFRCYPQPWQVWIERSPGQYELLAETPQRPVGEALDQIFMNADAAIASDSSTDGTAGTAPASGRSPSRQGFFAELQQFLRALSQ